MTSAILPLNAVPLGRTGKEILFRARLGMLFFLAAEAMFFAGLISAYIVLSAQVPVWPPPDQPRLPWEVTGFNTIVLLWSGLALAVAARTAEKEPGKKSFFKWLVLATCGGIVFLGIQGHEWVELVEYGLATSHSVYAGTFYALIGVHALHVAGGVAVLTILSYRAARPVIPQSYQPFFAAARLYWYFVVGVWPILYGIVYWH